MKAGPLTYTGPRPRRRACSGNGWLGGADARRLRGVHAAPARCKYRPMAQLRDLRRPGQVLGDGGAIGGAAGRGTVSIGTDGSVVARGPGEAANGLAQVGHASAWSSPPPEGAGTR